MTDKELIRYVNIGLSTMYKVATNFGLFEREYVGKRTIAMNYDGWVRTYPMNVVFFEEHITVYNRHFDKSSMCIVALWSKKSNFESLKTKEGKFAYRNYDELIALLKQHMLMQQL